MTKTSLSLLILILFSLSAQGQTPAWSTEVAPILYNRCATCHHSGGIAPFSLMTYSDAVANASTMAVDVDSRRMPPWPPDPNYSHFAHERILSTDEINAIKDWVNGGTPQGDPNLAPPPPVYTTTGMLQGTPDYIGQIPTFTSTANTGDVYQCFVIPSGLLTDKFITAFEAVPGNPAIVHHVLVYYDTTGYCRHLDSLTAGPGYVSFGGVGSNDAVMIGGWVPGGAPMVYPNGFGVQVPHNADIVLQIHYPAGTAGMADSTQVHFFFAPNNNGIRNVYIAPVLNYYTNINHSLFIPANETKWFQEKYTAPIDFSLLGIAPHMHLIGKQIKSYGIPATSQTDTQKYINIKDWDFHWQGFYMFPKIRKVSGGTTVYADAYYDNTTNNPDNPNNPPQDVSAGEATTNEMMLVYYVFTPYQPGDENIVIDSTSGVSTLNYYRGQQLLSPYPNPAKGALVVKCYLQDPDVATIDLLNVEGKTVQHLMNEQSINNGYTTHSFKLDNLPSGIYNIQMRTSQRVLTQKVVVTQ